MSKHLILRFLLSLVLLVSQHIAMAHALAHGPMPGAAPSLEQLAASGDVVQQALEAQDCPLCEDLDLPELAPPCAPHASFENDTAFAALALPADSPACARTRRAFLSRAPPQA